MGMLNIKYLRKMLMYLIALTEPGYACVGGRSTGNPAHYHRNALNKTKKLRSN
jgi:hypothetical protein